MKKLLFFVSLCCMGIGSSAQSIFPYKDIKLEKPSDYSETEPMALSAATFILTTPFVENNGDRASALLFISDWVRGTKDYSFYTKGKVADLTSEPNILSLYVSAMVKYTLENKAEAVNPMRIELNATQMVLAYCNDEKNNFKLKKKYRKILEN